MVLGEEATTSWARALQPPELPGLDDSGGSERDGADGYMSQPRGHDERPGLPAKVFAHLGDDPVYPRVDV